MCVCVDLYFYTVDYNRHVLVAHLMCERETIYYYNSICCTSVVCVVVVIYYLAFFTNLAIDRFFCTLICKAEVIYTEHCTIV